MNIAYHSSSARQETEHTVSLLRSHLSNVHSALDVGCGSGYVAAALAQEGVEVAAVDVVDMRRAPLSRFRLFDGLTLPFADGSFDLVMMNFVLHHVPDDRKPQLLREAARVARRRLFILEDTPVTGIDRLFSHLHGSSFRRKLDGHPPFGFLTRREWEWFFKGLGLSIVASQPLGRFCRSALQPFARTLFVLDQASDVQRRDEFRTAS